MYVDYAGKTLLSVIDKHTGKINEVQFFVAILGASQYTYAEASMSQQKEDFVNSVENAIRFFGGTPLPLFLIKSSRFEHTINETLAAFAEYYQTTILPVRAYKPKENSLVEGAVQRIYLHLKDQ